MTQLVLLISLVACEKSTGSGDSASAEAGSTDDGATGGGATGGGATGGGTTGDTDDATGGATGGSGDTGGDTGAGGASGDTWTSFAEAFFSDYCVSCHSPDGQASADFRDYDVVTQRLDAIRCGTAPESIDGCAGSYPPNTFPAGSGPMPTDEERWALVAWIDAGAPY